MYSDAHELNTANERFFQRVEFNFGLMRRIMLVLGRVRRLLILSHQTGRIIFERYILYYNRIHIISYIYIYII